MKEALRQAYKAYLMEEVPVGAVLVKDGKIVSRGFNKKESLHNPLAHAELEAIDQASKILGTWRLTGTTLYVTLEPCPMCAGAIMNARIDRVVIGTRDEKRGCCGSRINLLDDEIFNHRSEVEFGVRARESSYMLSKFFKDLREGRKA